MSEDKNKVADKASEIARNIWLAGVGAYGKAVEEAQGRLEKAMEPPKLFRDLVKAGTALEEDARESTIAARHSVEERISRVRENFHNQRPARIEDLIALQKKVDQLSRKVDRLRREIADKETASSPKKKRRDAVKKATAGPSTKPSGARKLTAGDSKKTSAKPKKSTSTATRKKSTASKRKVR